MHSTRRSQTGLPALLLMCALIGATRSGGSARAEEANKPILQIESGGHTAICWWVRFTPDGRQLVSGGNDKVVRVWDLGEVIEAFQRGDSLPTNAALPTIPLVRSLRQQIGPGNGGKIYAGAISSMPLPGGGWLLAVGGYTEGHQIRLLDLASGQVVGLLLGHSNVITSLAFSRDGKLLASGSYDGTVRVWDLGERAADWSKAEDGTLKIPCQVLEGHTDSVEGLTFVQGADGEATLASGSDDKTLRLWRRDRNGRWSSQARLTGHTAEVREVAASPDGRYLASSSEDRSVRLWDARDGKFRRVLGEVGGSFPVSARLGFTPDGQALVAAADDNTAGGSRVWRIPEGGEIASFHGHDNLVRSVAVAEIGPASSVAGRRPGGGGPLVASTGGNNNDIFFWDAASGRTLGHIVGAGRPVWSVALSSDAQWLAWGSKTPSFEQVPQAKGELGHLFDLSEMKVGSQPVINSVWQRAWLTLAGWSAEVATNAKNTLIIRRDGREVSRVVRQPPADRINCHSFVPNGGLIVGSGFGLTLCDPATGKDVRQFVAHTADIWAVAVSPDGRLLVSGSADQTFRLWNIGTGELLLSVFVGFGADGSAGEWVAWTPAGYYKSSPGGDKLIGWHLNRGPDKAADFVAAWQMRKLFDKPDIVELIPATLSVAGAVEQYNKQPGQRRVEPLKIEEDIERLRPPTITIYEPANYQNVKTERVKLRAKVFPTGRQPITEMRVLVNGRPAPDFPALAPATGAGSAQPRDIEGEVVLEAGSNAIELLAATASASSAPVRVDVVRETRSPDAQPTKPDCYFLGIGVANYQDKSLELKFPAEDVRGLAAAVLRQQGKLFGKVETNLVLNTQATSRGIKGGLAWLKRSVTQRDLAIVLVSSHGWPDAQSGLYIAPFEFDPEAPSETGVSKGEFLERLSLLPCKVIFLLDACHSGRTLKGQEFASNWKGLNDGVERVVKEFSSIGSGLVVFASSGGEEKSVEDPAWGHGAFALALIEAMTGDLTSPTSTGKVTADADSDGVLQLNEFSVYVANRVKELTGGNQHALTGLGNVQSFPLAIFGRPTTFATDLTKQRPKGVRSEALTLRLADLKPELQTETSKRLAEPKRYEKVLNSYYAGKGTVMRTAAGELEFQVDRLRGVVTGEPSRWEQLTLTFYVEADEQQARLRCTGWGLHVKSTGTQPPDARAYQNSLYPEYESALKRHVGELMTRLEDSFKQ